MSHPQVISTIKNQVINCKIMPKTKNGNIKTKTTLQWKEVNDFERFIVNRRLSSRWNSTFDVISAGSSSFKFGKLHTCDDTIAVPAKPILSCNTNRNELNLFSCNQIVFRAPQNDFVWLDSLWLKSYRFAKFQAHNNVETGWMFSEGCWKGPLWGTGKPVPWRFHISYEVPISEHPKVCRVQIVIRWHLWPSH